jgi:hypothetical protein
MKRNAFYLALLFVLLPVGRVDAQAFGWLKKQRKLVEQTALRSSATGQLPAMPRLSGVVTGSPAAKQVARPTTVFRESTSFPEERQKYECEYDNYGHITALKTYLPIPSMTGFDYVLQTSVVNEYRQMHNGEFVKTKVEYAWTDIIKRRYTADYDGKGMLLWSQTENYNFDTFEWELVERNEAILDNAGIRTGMKRNGVPDSRYAFDDKGRIAYNDDSEGYSGYTMSYTWNDDDCLVEMIESETIDYNGDALPDYTYTCTYWNFEIVYNEKYFNPYGLSPLYTHFDGDYGYFPNLWGDYFSVDDYALHQVHFNVDATIAEGNRSFQAQLRTTVNSDGSHIEQVATIETEPLSVTMTTIDVSDEYGSYHISQTGSDGLYDNIVVYVVYNEYGELCLNYEKEHWLWENEETFYEIEERYTRDRDNQYRPVKTVYTGTYNAEPSDSWEETYTTWTTITTGIRDFAAGTITVFPNPATQTIRLSGIEGKASIAVFDSNGRRALYHSSFDGRESLSVSHLPAGVYFVRIEADGKVETTGFLLK